MATAYSTNLKLALPTQGELDGAWGNAVNSGITWMIDSMLAYVAVTITPTANKQALTFSDPSLSGSPTYTQAKYNCLKLNAGTLSANFELYAPPIARTFVIWNNTGYQCTFYVATAISGTTAAGTGVVIPDGKKVAIFTDGTNAVEQLNYFAGGITLGTDLAVADGGTGISSGTSGGILYFSAPGTLASSGVLASNAIVLGGGAGTTPATTTTGTGVVTAVGNAVNTSGGLVTQSGTLTANNILLGGGASTAISSSSLLATSAAVTSGTYIKAIGYADTVVALGNTGTAINLDVVSGGVFTATLTGSATITLRYPVSSGSSSFTLILTNDGTAGRTVAWAGGSFKFPGGAASLSRTTTANAVDIWVFFTPDGGTTWYGNIAMKNMTT
jgi:hypothetical protein